VRRPCRRPAAPSLLTVGQPPPQAVPKCIALPPESSVPTSQAPQPHPPRGRDHLSSQSCPIDCLLPSGHDGGLCGLGIRTSDTEFHRLAMRRVLVRIRPGGLARGERRPIGQAFLRHQAFQCREPMLMIAGFEFGAAGARARLLGRARACAALIGPHYSHDDHNCLIQWPRLALAIAASRLCRGEVRGSGALHLTDEATSVLGAFFVSFEESNAARVAKARQLTRLSPQTDEVYRQR
jgi:hypothetical protein